MVIVIICLYVDCSLSIDMRVSLGLGVLVVICKKTLSSCQFSKVDIILYKFAAKPLLLTAIRNARRSSDSVLVNCSLLSLELLNVAELVELVHLVAVQVQLAVVALDTSIATAI